MGAYSARRTIFIMIDLNKMLDNFFTKKGIGADYFDPLDSKSPLIKQIESSISKDNIINHLYDIHWCLLPFQ